MSKDKAARPGPRARKSSNGAPPSGSVAHGPPVVRVYETLCNYKDSTLSEFLDLTAGIIGKAILRDREIVFDWIDEDGDAVQHTRLCTTDGIRYSGYTSDTPNNGTDRARFEATLYSNGQGHILLGQGIWESDQRRESFIIQLHSGQALAEG